MKTLKSSEGFALFIAILVMALVMLFLGASLLLSRVDTKITSNFKLGTQALEVADTGLLHALQLLQPQNGWDFNDSFTCPTPPCDVISNTLSSAPEFTYTVTVENDAVDINNGGSPTDDTDNRVVLVSMANGPNSSTRQIQAYVNRSQVSFSPPGGLYIPASTATFNFPPGAGNSGNFPPGAGNFTGFITGDDTTYTDSNSDGWADPSTGTGTATAITGVAPINNTVRDSFKSAMGSTRYNLVQGASYLADPLTPSVVTTADVIDVNKIALNFFNNVAAENLHVAGLPASDCTSSSPCVFGTDASPQITYIREGADFINPNGYATGSGVIVFEGKTQFRKDFEFHGLVIGVKEGLTGGTDPGTVNADYFSLSNDSKIFGAVLLGPTNSTLGFEMKDNAKIYYNSVAISMAQSLCGSCFPQPPKVFAWFEK